MLLPTDCLLILLISCRDAIYFLMIFPIPCCDTTSDCLKIFQISCHAASDCLMIFLIPFCDVTSVMLGPTFVMPCMILFCDATSIILEMLHLCSLILCIFESMYILFF